MYEFKPSPDLLPIMPGTRIYAVNTEDYRLEDEELYAEAVVVTGKSLQVVIYGEIHDLGDEYFLTPEEALEWIRDNRKTTIWDLLEKALHSPIWQEGLPPQPGWYLFKLSGNTMRKAYFYNNTLFREEPDRGHIWSHILEWAYIPDYLADEPEIDRCSIELEDKAS